MKNNMKELIALLVTGLLFGCTHLQKDKPPPPVDATSAIKSTPEESETNVESPGLSPEEANTDADVQVEF